MECTRLTLLSWLILVHTILGHAQELSQYDRFQLYEGELYWQNNYECPGNADSVRQAVESMFKFQAFTFSVIANPYGYSGKLSHYKVNPKRFGRSYLNTSKMYWGGEWSGKFSVKVEHGHYTVTIYDLRFKSKTQSVGHYAPEKIRSGKYIDEVTTRDKQSLLRSEFLNLHLMSVSLKESFDISNTAPVQKDR